VQREFVEQSFLVYAKAADGDAPNQNWVGTEIRPSSRVLRANCNSRASMVVPEIRPKFATPAVPAGGRRQDG